MLLLLLTDGGNIGVIRYLIPVVIVRVHTKSLVSFEVVLILRD